MKKSPSASSPAWWTLCANPASLILVSSPSPSPTERAPNSMTAAVANSSFPTPDDLSLRRFLLYSLFLHGAVAAAMIVSIVFHFQGNRWGDVGGGSEGEVNVKLVGSIGLPMPKPPDVTESKTFDPTDSIYKTLPQPKPPEPPKPEIKIPEFKKEKPPKQIEHRSRVFDNPTPAPDNAVAQHGGKMDLPVGTSNVAGAAAPGVKVQGQGGGDFASRRPAATIPWTPPRSAPCSAPRPCHRCPATIRVRTLM